MPTSPAPPPSSAGKAADVFVLRVDLSDGRALFPAYISQAEADWKEQLRDAEAFFDGEFQGKGVITVEMAPNLYRAGVATPESVPAWKSYREALLAPDGEDDPFGPMVLGLSGRAVSTRTLHALKQHLRPEENERHFLDHVDESTYPAAEKEAIRKALARAGTPGAAGDRRSEADRASNHGVQVADRALTRLQLSGEAVQACLLGAAVAGGGVTPAEAKRGFTKSVGRLLDDIAAARKGEKAVSALQGEALSLEALDRMQGLVECFGRKDRDRVAAYVAEARRVHYPIVTETRFLGSISLEFERLLEEAERCLLSAP